MRRRLSVVGLVLIFAVTSLFTGCGDGAVDRGTDGEFVFVELEHAGFLYLCIYTYEGSSDSGGPAMWCENVGASG